MRKKIIPSLLLLSILFGQKSDPRTVALAGATTTIADGIYAVGYNPALIAYQREKPFMMQVGGFDLGLNNKASVVMDDILDLTAVGSDYNVYNINSIDK